ncbi:MAG: NAD-dependent epimerase/dehydratase family protein [Chthoniobacterales bacterium]
MNKHSLGPDCAHILAQTQDLWEELRGEKIFVTGGTGFFGCWLLEAFCFANTELELNAKAVVLSRDPRKFAAKAPHLAEDSGIQLLAGDVNSVEFPAGHFSHVIHAALDYGAPLPLFVNAVDATRRTLEFAVRSGARRYLLTSSGAVYGRQPPELTRVPEDYLGGPRTTDLRSSYGEAKRGSEFLCAAFHAEDNLHTTIARGFAFVGPYLALDQGSAIGNFIGDALQGDRIRINADGTPRRSYLYGADLAIWLWTILLRGAPARPYNVGAEPDFSIAEVAQIVAEEVNPRVQIEIAQKPDPAKPAERYVPSTQRARAELGLKEWIDVREGVRQTAAWNAARIAA